MAESIIERKPLGETYGGSAVIEGVMMRGRHRAAIAVRPDLTGDIVIKEESLSGLYSGAISRIPFLRGIPMLWDAMGLGTKALFFSAELMGRQDDPNFKMSGGMGFATGALSLLLGVLLFMVVPSLGAGVVIPKGDLLFNGVEGVLRLLVLTAYIVLVSQTAEIRRVFGYHGAEHKTVNAHEAGSPLTVEGVRAHSRLHPRCGTAFLLTVALISVLVLAPFGKPPLPIRIATRLVLLPLISAISYEVLRFTANRKDNRIIRLLIAPNLLMQRLTTREPDDQMIEVAIAALKAVISAEDKVDLLEPLVL
jgi:uncharacterized protein YqhQ